MKKVTYIIISFVLLSTSVFGQQKKQVGTAQVGTAQVAAAQVAKPVAAPKNKIQWLTIEQAYARNQTEPRKFMIDVYTDWCGWCKVMDKNTFTNQKVIDYVNQKYYAVKFDAEQTADVTLGTKSYQYQPQSKAHGLAINLLNGQMSYPNIVFLDEKMGMIQPVAGYQEPQAFHKIIAFFGGNYHQKEQFEQFSKQTYVKLFP